MIEPIRTAKLVRKTISQEEGEALMRMSVIWVCRSPIADVSLDILVYALISNTFRLGTLINQQSRVNSAVFERHLEA